MPVVFRNNLDYLLRKAGEYMDFEGLELVRLAYEFTIESNRRFEFLRFSGEPAISHPLAVAEQLVDWRMNPETVAAGILHDIIEDPNIHALQLRSTFGDTVTRMVDGVSKLKKFELPSSTAADTAYHYKIFLAVAQNPRVAIIKIADRLHNLRTLDSMPGYKRLKTSYETEQIFIPLSRFLGIEAVAEEMEDIAFQYARPNEFAQLLDRLEDLVAEEDEVFNKAIDEIEPAMLATGLEYQAHIFRYNLSHARRILNSPDRPMPKTGLVELTVPEEDDCYRALQAVHKTFQSLSIGFQDTINFPSIDLKRMIETSLLGPLGRPLVIRIISREMKQVNRWGILPFLATPEELKRKDMLEDRVELIQKIVESFRKRAGDRDEKELVDILTRVVLKQKVFVFTKDRRKLELPESSTVLDFAYLMDTEIGNHYSSALIYQEPVEMGYQPQLFDHLYIVTDDKAEPHVDWLKHAHTPEAQGHIKRWLASQPRDKSVAEGQRVILDKASSEGIAPSGRLEDIEHLVEPIYQFLGFRSAEDLYEQIGKADFNLDIAMDFLKEQFKKVVLIDPAELEPKLLGDKAYHEPLPTGTIDAERQLKSQPTLCEMCSPLPGDEIVVRTSSKQTIVHRAACRHIERGFLRGPKILTARWNRTNGRAYPCRIKIKIFPSKDVQERITRVFENAGAKVAASLIGAPGPDGLHLMEFILELDGEAKLRGLCDELIAIKDVVFAKRI